MMPTSSPVIKRVDVAARTGADSESAALSGLAVGLGPAPVTEQATEAMRSRMMAELEQESEAIRSAAHDAGFAEGLARAAAFQGDQLDRLVRIVNNAVVEQMQWVRAAEREVISLTLRIAERAVQAELTLNPELVVMAVRRGLDAIEAAAGSEVRVNPADIDLVGNASDIGADGQSPARFALVADARIERGGCSVRWGERRIDAQPQAALAAIERVFKEHWGEQT